MTPKYNIYNHDIQTILTWVKSNEIAIPEIQRPFVWDSSKVRDLIDSLFQGYPIGYIILWKNPNVRLKSGGLSDGKKILIDGQQRITALTAAILGQEVVDQNYEKIKIKIAVNPANFILEDENSEDKKIFEVSNIAVQKDKTWISDISEIFSGSIHSIAQTYVENNSQNNLEQVYGFLESIKNILNRSIGVMELSHDLPVETVTEIFIRINSKGVILNQADFAMSKIAANSENDGVNIRKTIDYFAHLSVKPTFISILLNNDKEFADTEYFKKIKWLEKEKSDLYDPDYGDILRVAFTSEFERGKLSDLVSLLSGRNFELRTYESEIENSTYERFSRSLSSFINETNFKRFVMIIESTGFTSKIIRSKNNINFAYILYLKLKSMKVNSHVIEQSTKKWFVMSILTSRYSGSPESMFDFDIKNIVKNGISKTLTDIEEAELSDNFWKVNLIQNLETSSTNSPMFHLFQASQRKAHDKGFLSKDIES